ncbi:ABC transporter substrate-binding protein [Candidatus Falkowbacteria bacterium]|nr:ABC transporter substrate-binding protein [Candidatus Falkowbacteria bacterium]
MSKSSKTITWLVVIVIIIAGIWYGVTRKTPPSEENPIKIGSILILTGEGASWGTAAKNGIDMALEKINSQGGIDGRKLVVVHEDDQSDPKNALSAFQKLTGIDGVSTIIGTTWSHTGLPLVDLAKENKTLIISPSLGVKDFNEASEYLFNTWPHDFYLSQELADYVYKKGHRKVALIGAQQVWVKDQTNAFKSRFEELGGSIEVLLEPNPTDKNANTDALKIKEKEADIDAIISTTDGILVGVQIAKRVREIGIELPIYSISIDADVIAAAEGAYEGMEFLTFLTPTQKFQKEYEEKYGLAIDIGAASAYDAAILIAEAMKETKSTDTAVLQEHLNKIEQYNGVSGELVSDGKGGFTKPFLSKKVVNSIPIDIR